MKFIKVDMQSCYLIDTDDGKEYVRFGAESWYEFMGQSLEPVYRDEELEAGFQAQLLKDGD